MRYIKKTLFFALLILISLHLNRTLGGQETFRYVITMPSEDAAVFVMEGPHDPSLYYIERTGRFILAESPNSLTSGQLLSLADNLNAVSVEKDEAVSALETDKYYGKQWAINGAENGINISYVADYVDKDNYPQEVVVAVVDTGVDVDHEDLSENIWVNPGETPGDGIDNDSNGYTDDVYGWDFYNDDETVCHYVTDEDTGELTFDPKDSDNHGTHVAGIIAAIPDNGVGISGVASPFVNVKIMVLKCLGGGSNLTPGKGSLYSTIKAIKYATSMGADICNVSWGNSSYSTGLYEAIKDSDMLFVTAAGNTADNNDKYPMYPASYDLPNVISVASTNMNGFLSGFSNYGPDSVDIAAPGEKIMSTVVGGYETMSGTSMSAPFISGIAAILYSTNGSTFPASVKEIIVGSGRFTPSLSGIIKNPVVADASVSASMNEFLEEDLEAPDLVSDIKIDDEINFTVDYKDIGASGLRSAKYLFGRKSLKAFHRGTVGLDLKNGTNILAKTGTYTVYLSDYTGNEEIFEIDAKEKPVSKIETSFSRKMLRKGRTYKIKYQVTPKVNTETISFSSSSKKIATVDKNGVITAKKKGSCDITIKSSGGVKTTFKLFVK